MNLVIPTGVFGDRPLEAVAKAVAAAGYDAVQLDLDPWSADVADCGLTKALAAHLAEAFERERLAVAAVRLATNLVGGGEAAADALLSVVELAQDFGTELVICTAGPGDDWTTALDALTEAADLAEDRDVAIALEIGDGQAVRGLDQAEPLIDAIESDSLGLSLDLLAVAEGHQIEVKEVLERVGDVLLVVTVTDLDAHGGVIAPAPGSGTDYGTLFDLLNEFAPDATIVAGGTLAASAAATRLYLARFL